LAYVARRPQQKELLGNVVVAGGGQLRHQIVGLTATALDYKTGEYAQQRKK
jgi:hypothetical protein